MIPEERFSTQAITGQLQNPWMQQANLSRSWGPIALQDPSDGLLSKLWECRVNPDSLEILLAPVGDSKQVWFTHSKIILEVSLSFDQNGRPIIGFTDVDADCWLLWFDPVPNNFVTLSVDGAITPRVTLDDARSFNSMNSDVILAYVRDGIIRYRRQRDRFTIEHTPTQGVGGDSIEAVYLRHISMNSALRLEFITSDERDPFPSIFLEANPDFDQMTSGNTVSTNILSNDLYYGEPVTLEVLDALPKITRAPLIGSVSINPDGTAKFTPPRGFRGVISYEYEISAPPRGAPEGDS